MNIESFDPSSALIVVPGLVIGPWGAGQLRLAIDTGAGETIIDPSVLDRLGYSARLGESVTVNRSVAATELGYMIRVQRFEALSHTFSDFRVNALDLPEGWDIDGLLGMSFMRRFDWHLLFSKGQIQTEQPGVTHG